MNFHHLDTCIQPNRAHRGDGGRPSNPPGSSPEAALLDRVLAACQEHCQDCGSDLYCEACDMHWVADQPCECDCILCGAARQGHRCPCGSYKFSNLDAWLGRAMLRKERAR